MDKIVEHEDGDQFDREAELDYQLSVFEQSVKRLQSAARAIADAAERRGDEIDVMIARIRENMASHGGRDS
jgi:hypothetical protein